MDVEALQEEIGEFAAERDWEQFHTPKNLAMALAGEAGELLEEFQWLTPEESQQLSDDPEALGRVEEEIADIQIYLLRLTEKLDIDLEEAVRHKLAENAEKYPVSVAKGNATKYDRR